MDSHCAKHFRDSEQPVAELGGQHSYTGVFTELPDFYGFTLDCGLLSRVFLGAYRASLIHTKVTMVLEYGVQLESTRYSDGEGRRPNLIGTSCNTPPSACCSWSRSWGTSDWGASVARGPLSVRVILGRLLGAARCPPQGASSRQSAPAVYIARCMLG